MLKVLAFSALVLGSLSGCSAVPQQHNTGACAQDPGGYACQVERYQKASG